METIDEIETTSDSEELQTLIDEADAMLNSVEHELEQVREDLQCQLEEAIDSLVDLKLDHLSLDIGTEDVHRLREHFTPQLEAYVSSSDISAIAELTEEEALSIAGLQ